MLMSKRRTIPGTIFFYFSAFESFDQESVLVWCATTVGDTYVLTNAFPGASAEQHHRFVHGTVPLLTLKPPLGSELVCMLAKNVFVESDIHRIHTNLKYIRS